VSIFRCAGLRIGEMIKNLESDDGSEMDRKKLKIWVKKAGKDVWDYAGMRKKRGKAKR
jgi:hypothetical protein